ncbi:hypothetical protein KNO15_21610 [Leifsonia shinshuensis]|uniref:hypothetical protein n=1 Tax=Leifsonia shinshuensis TaxID=150026 RepID=UPI001F511112|nr:hypothetical protein [Leifsonia shinshuensis]MCI0159306.1 hypothetical protein [Leifsonia shinshuensis]
MVPSLLGGAGSRLPVEQQLAPREFSSDAAARELAGWSTDQLVRTVAWGVRFLLWSAFEVEELVRFQADYRAGISRLFPGEQLVWSADGHYLWEDDRGRGVTRTSPPEGIPAERVFALPDLGDPAFEPRIWNRVSDALAELVRRWGTDPSDEAERQLLLTADYGLNAGRTPQRRVIMRRLMQSLARLPDREATADRVVEEVDAWADWLTSEHALLRVDGETTAAGLLAQIVARFAFDEPAVLHEFRTRVRAAHRRADGSLPLLEPFVGAFTRWVIAEGHGTGLVYAGVAMCDAVDGLVSDARRREAVDPYLRRLYAIWPCAYATESLGILLDSEGASLTETERRRFHHVEEVRVRLQDVQRFHLDPLLTSAAQQRTVSRLVEAGRATGERGLKRALTELLDVRLLWPAPMRGELLRLAVTAQEGSSP